MNTYDDDISMAPEDIHAIALAATSLLVVGYGCAGHMTPLLIWLAWFAAWLWMEGARKHG